MLLNISKISTANTNNLFAGKKTGNTSNLTFSAKSEPQNEYENLHFKNLNYSDYCNMKKEFYALNEFAKENNKEIILSSKNYLVQVIMRPIKKESNFFKRIFGLDASIGWYSPCSYYDAMFLAKELLDNQTHSINRYN